VKILVLNGGSSSIRAWFSDLPDGPLPVDAARPLWSARVDWSHHSGVAEVRIAKPDQAATNRQFKVNTPVEVLEPVLQLLLQEQPRIDVVGHRIVHGGPVYRETTRLTPEVRAAVAQQVEFAPVHNRFELEAIQAVDRVLGPGIPQIAVFDTGFHSTLEPAAYVYPGPYAWLEQGIRRYGFHGISHRYASRRATQILKADPETLKLIVCHLGSGGSLAAIRAGKSVDTTMGFTPLEGLMMGTRCGSVDPGILVCLIRHRGYTAEQLDDILNKESGLLGISGVSGDMREIVQAIATGDPGAHLAFDVYVHRLTREIGGMLAVLGGMDALVFTGGIGENCAQLRQVACAQLAFLGLKLETSKNARTQGDEDIASPDSSVRVLVIRAEEEWEIARECQRVVSSLQN